MIQLHRNKLFRLMGLSCVVPVISMLRDEAKVFGTQMTEILRMSTDFLFHSLLSSRIEFVLLAKILCEILCDLCGKKYKKSNRKGRKDYTQRAQRRITVRLSLERSPKNGMITVTFACSAVT